MAEQGKGKDVSRDSTSGGEESAVDRARPPASPQQFDVDADLDKNALQELFAPVAGFGVSFSTIFKPVATEQYPFEKVGTFPRYHGRHQLNRYADGLEKCIGCRSEERRVGKEGRWRCARHERQKEGGAERAGGG